MGTKYHIKSEKMFENILQRFIKTASTKIQFFFIILEKHIGILETIVFSKEISNLTS